MGWDHGRQRVRLSGLWRARRPRTLTAFLARLAEYGGRNLVEARCLLSSWRVYRAVNNLEEWVVGIQFVERARRIMRYDPAGCTQPPRRSELLVQIYIGRAGQAFPRFGSTRHSLVGGFSAMCPMRHATRCSRRISRRGWSGLRRDTQCSATLGSCVAPVGDTPQSLVASQAWAVRMAVHADLHGGLG